MKVIYPVIFICYCFLPASLNAQEVEIGTANKSDIIDFFEENITSSNNTVIILTEGGNIMTQIDSCVSVGDYFYYIFWKEEKNTMVTSMNPCMDFHTVEIVNFPLWKTLESNFQEIVHSKFQSNTFISHYSYEELTLLKNGNTYEVKMMSNFFWEEDKYYENNIKQPAKVFVKKLKTWLR